MHGNRRNDSTWAIVLAGGEGARLAMLTEALHDHPVPKQFARISGGESMLHTTLRRIARIAAPRRTVVVVGRDHLRWIRAQLGPRRGITVLLQPSNLGTASGLLYALSWIRQRHATAHVLVFPSDHHVENAARFCDAARDAERVARTAGLLTLIGVRPSDAETDYGWIVPGHDLARDLAPANDVEEFVEKPNLEDATRLRDAGALWNTLILAAPAGELWRLARCHLPVHATAFESLDRFSFAVGAPDLDEIYRRLPAADLSRQILQVAAPIAVVPMSDAGWSDWGTPERVLASLRGTPAEARIRARLRAYDERHALDDPRGAAHTSTVNAPFLALPGAASCSEAVRDVSRGALR